MHIAWENCPFALPSGLFNKADAASWEKELSKQTPRGYSNLTVGFGPWGRMQTPAFGAMSKLQRLNRPHHLSWLSYLPLLQLSQSASHEGAQRSDSQKLLHLPSCRVLHCIGELSVLDTGVGKLVQAMNDPRRAHLSLSVLYYRTN
jgi:hypothetical protein